MTEPGEQWPAGGTPPPATQGRRSGWMRLRPSSLPAALAEASLVALLSATAWALIKGILEFPGVLAVAVVGGWAIGALLWQVRATPVLAIAIGILAWGIGLVLTWLVAMAILPSSARTFLERVEGTPFLDWMGPQFGAVEMVGLVLYVAAAAYGARPRT